MPTVTTDRDVDLESLPWGVVQYWRDGVAHIDAPDAPDGKTLRAAVGSAPDAGWRERNADTIRARADQALEGLRTIAGSSGTLTGAQLSNAVRLLARACIALVRLSLSRLDNVD